MDIFFAVLVLFVRMYGAAGSRPFRSQPRGGGCVNLSELGGISSGWDEGVPMLKARAGWLADKKTATAQQKQYQGSRLSARLLIILPRESLFIYCFKCAAC